VTRFDPQLLKYLKRKERKKLNALLDSAHGLWTPLPGPQTDAYNSKADIVGYGGAAGGGKTDLAIGLALTRHQKVGIFRQNGTELTAIIDRIGDVLGHRDGFNATKNIWRCQRSDGVPMQIELGSFPSPGDEKKYQGRPHDLLVFDEAANMREISVRFLLGWLRTIDPNQRKRALLNFNPPTTVEGRWIVSFFAPWIDRKHPHPAEPGELRWFATVDGVDLELDNGDQFEHEGDLITPLSRTFIPSRISDNPHLLNTGYMAQLQAMPEPLRSQMLHGDFAAGMEDDPWQVIPTAWVEMAMERWEKPRKLEPMESIGVDVAMGGRDNTVLARRHEGMWFDEPIVYRGTECPDGPTIAGYVIAAMRDRAVIHIDLFGVGAQPYGHLSGAGQQVIGVNVGDPANGTDASGKLTFKNVRSMLWWRMRDALDPHANNGIALPPDKRVLADLCSPTWKLVGRSLQVSSREEIIAKIGRSPDFGSAYCLALMPTPKVHLVMGITGREEYDPYRNM
jgi:hypothetical protein